MGLSHFSRCHGQSVPFKWCILSSQEIVTSPHADADAGIKSPDRLSADTVLQDSSLAEGAAGLLAMTSTADRAKDVQVTPSLSSCLKLLPIFPLGRCPMLIA